MIEISDLDQEAMQALKPGEVVRSTASRTKDHRFIVFEQVILTSLPHDAMSVILLRTDHTQVGYDLAVEEGDGSGVTFGVAKVNARPVLVEEAQLRTQTQAGLDLALGILEHIARLDPQALRGHRDRIRAVAEAVK